MKKGAIYMLLVLFFFCVVAKPVSAFAGGGGADYNGGGNDGGTGDTTNDYWSDRSNPSDDRSSNPFTFLLSVGVGAIIFVMNRKKLKQGIKTRKDIEILDYQKPEEAEIDLHVEKIFYPIQEAWQKQNLLAVEKYYSKELFDLHTKKITKMKNKHQKNVIEDLVLRKVGNLQWLEGNKKFSVEIEARAIDYVIDTRNERVIKGRKNEYGILREKWFFQKNTRGLWILYKIK